MQQYQSTYASNMTPTRKVEAVPNLPIHQVAIGDTSRADQGFISPVRFPKVRSESVC